MAEVEYVRMPKADYVAACESIRAKTGKEDKIKSGAMASEIDSITTGGGSSEDVRYVTFMSEDGSIEYGKKAVAVGDDCADPIARNVFAKPTKESTAQYNFTFAGWATAPNGGLNDSALKAVNEDKVVYANFASVVRYYTITFFDGDSVIESKQMAYGSTPTISAPTKDGYSFDGWEPALTTVTGDANYQAKWLEQITFAGGSWDDIARISEEGNAAAYFALGDQKDITYTHDGTTYTATVEIVAFNFDDKADGSGKAGITVCTTDTTPWYGAKHKNTNLPDSQWPNCDARKLFDTTIYNTFDADLKNAIKPVTKLTNGHNGSSATTFTTTDKVWIPSVREAYGSDVSSTYGTYAETGEKFQRYTLKKTQNYPLRSGPKSATVNTTAVVRDTGAVIMGSPASTTYFVFGFSI